MKTNKYKIIEIQVSIGVTSIGVSGTTIDRNNLSMFVLWSGIYLERALKSENLRLLYVMDMVNVQICMYFQLDISVRLCVMAATEKSRQCDGAGQSKFETHCSALVCYTSVQKLVPYQRGCQQYLILFIKHQERAYTVCFKAREKCSRLLGI